MKRLRIIVLLLGAVALTASAAAQGFLTTADEALNIAQNRITLTIHQRGHWGGYDNALVTHSQGFHRGDRLLGYFCPVNPIGYVIVSIRPELAPVKVWSDTSNLDPESDAGMADLLKARMEQIILDIEGQLGPIETIDPRDLDTVLGTNHTPAWEILITDPEQFARELASGGLRGDYEEGDILLETHWRQGPPYNDDCPAPPPGDDCGEPRCVVGCVATAGAQIMRYWHWPPYGVGSPYNDEYDWVHMPIRAFTDSPPSVINAVAELSHEVGIAVNMDYCGGDDCQSEAYTSDMVGVFEDHFRYESGISVQWRRDYDTADDWFDRLRDQFNANRPVQYRVLGHSIVGDGWRIDQLGVSEKQYHMNYGWDNNYTSWWTLDNLYQPGGGTTDDEYMLEDIVPIFAMGSMFQGDFPLHPLFPYRYFDRDATCGPGATFTGGQLYQFLPSVTVTCTGSSAAVRFYGDASGNTRFYTRGDTANGVRIYDGGVKLLENGSIVLR